MTNLLRNLLKRYFWLGVEGDGDDDTQPADPPHEDATPPDDETFLLDDEVPAEEPAKPSAEDRLAAAERRAEELQRELSAARSSQPTAPVQPSRDPDYEREEQQLAEARRNGATEDQERWLRWQIDSNRTIRQANKTSQAALAEAREIADRSDFSKLEITKPKTFKAYKDRVEQAIGEMRAKGQQIPPRMLVLSVLIGQDALAGKTQQKPKAKAAESSTVERKRLPGTRSDVSSSGKQSERDKRRARLENVNI